MSWGTIIKTKLHPQKILDRVVDVILWMMEIWALVRVFLILSLVLVTVLLYIIEVTPNIEEITKNLEHCYENYCTVDKPNSDIIFGRRDGT